MPEPREGRNGRSDAKRIAEAIDSLYATYKPEGVGIWLVSRNWNVDGLSPLGLLHLGRVDEFCAACEALIAAEIDRLQRQEAQGG